MTFTMPGGARRLLWGLIGLLAVIVVLEWLWPAGGGAAVAPARLAGRAVQGQPAPARDTSGWGGTILARPLFSISRRPPRVVASNHAQEAAGQARLAGIMITRQGRRAIFAPDGGGKQLVLPEGAAVNETTIARIQPDRVTLASGAVLIPSYDHNRTGAPLTTPPYQPVNPGFPNPGFPNPGFPTQGFPNPAFPNPGVGNPAFGNPNFGAPGSPGVFPNPNFQPPAQAPNADDAGQAPPQVPPPPLRGAMIPQRRE